ncbi:universal stress protein [Planctobacterium marinum]|uniref:UspA domain-containing protein n=1 Tax=Planctobacterium marinum TaxID=1631968 RepID=A0AA48KSF4_9ALTE|nr:hypothetical protein MACH26_26030 [Planctobacterium marinum]
MTEQLIKSITWLVDGRHDVHPAVTDKVLTLAKLQQAKINLIFDNRLRARERHYWFLFEQSEQVESDWRQQQQLKQQALKDALEESQISYNFEIVENANYLDSVKKYQKTIKNSLVVIQDQAPGDRHPVFQDLANINSHILLLTPKPWSKNMSLLGAVDPLHEHSRPEDMDFVISRKTQHLAKLFKCEWFIGHACHIPASFVQYKHKISTLHRQGLDDFMARIGVTSKHGILLSGLPERALPEWIAKQKTDILLLGNVTRNALFSHLVGSTTAALLSKPPCDMLLVKSQASS